MPLLHSRVSAVCDDCGFMLVMKRIVGVTASSRWCRPSLGEWRKVKAALWTRSSHRKRRCSSYTVSAEKKKNSIKGNHSWGHEFSSILLIYSALFLLFGSMRVALHDSQIIFISYWALVQSTLAPHSAPTLRARTGQSKTPLQPSKA